MHFITYVPSHTLLRQAISAHEPWVRSRLGCSLAETAILRTHFVFAQLGLTLLANSELAQPTRPEIEAVRRELELVTLPPGQQPILDLAERIGRSESRCRVGRKKPHPYALTWAESPVAIKVRSLPCEVIAMRVIRFGEAFEPGESIDDILVFPRQYSEHIAAFLVRLTEREDRPMVRTWGETARPIQPLDWDQLTLAPEIRTLLRDDFESFFRDADWYKAMHIPHRRGYLLHGPPGNGKTSAVRAMLTSRGLTGYQLRLFAKHTDDADLENVFAHAAAISPSIVLLEDLDRAFPRSGHTESKVHLQPLLNALDGVATEPGVIAVATANEPSLLDPAILRRPGRFDRVVHFSNPDPALRSEYLVSTCPALAGHDLGPAVEVTAGFSFAFLQEMYIMAAQAARCTSRPLTVADFVSSSALLRQGYQSAGKKGAAAGFIVGD